MASELLDSKRAWHRKLTAKGHRPAWRYERTGSPPFYVGTCRNCAGRVEVDDMGAQVQNLGWGPGIRQCRGRR